MLARLRISRFVLARGAVLAREAQPPRDLSLSNGVFPFFKHLWAEI